MFENELMKKIFSDFTEEEIQMLDYATNPLLRDRTVTKISLLREDLDKMGPELLEENKISEAMNIAEAMVWLEMFETLLKSFNKIDNIFPTN
jgi:hypothetical protein